MKPPLLAVLVLTLDDGTEVYRSPPVGRLGPGDSVSVQWTYPEAGLPEPDTLPVTLRHGESVTVEVTETYPPA